jgi:hypothetical protein
MIGKSTGCRSMEVWCVLCDRVLFVQGGNRAMSRFGRRKIRRPRVFDVRQRQREVDEQGVLVDAHALLVEQHLVLGLSHAATVQGGDAVKATSTGNVDVLSVCCQARRMNESGLFDPPLPSLHPKHAFVYIPHPKQEFDFDWFQQLFAVASGGAKLNFKNTLDQELDDDHWMCFRQAVLPGTFGGVVRIWLPCCQTRTVV